MNKYEIALNTATKEYEKAEKGLTRHQELLIKKTEKCNKLECNWSVEEFNRRRKIISERHPNSWIIPFGEDDDIMTEKQSEAWWSLDLEKDHLKEAEDKFKRATEKLAKVTGEYDDAMVIIEADKEIEAKENSWISNMAKAEAEYEEWLKQFKAECLKDGVVIENANSNYINGKTKSGKDFCLSINNGYTLRSRYCYTLYVEGETIFTSGTFGTGYRYIKH